MQKSFWTLNDFNFNGKTVLVRADFNVPLNNEGKITDNRRIRAAIPTISFLLKSNAKVILISHLGRPFGIDEKLRMDPVANCLKQLLKRRIIKLNDCVGNNVQMIVKNMQNQDIILLENLRFYDEEEKNSKDFAQALAELADIYVNDAFGAMHRAHASVDAITDFLPSCAGFLVEKEVSALKILLNTKKNNFVAVIGGAKISDKIKLMNTLANKVEFLLVGGAMAFTFLKSQKKNVGKSVVEDKMIGFAKNLLANHTNIILPIDITGNKNTLEKSKPITVLASDIPANFTGLDIGAKTIKLFEEYLKKANTIFWNGPLGMCEVVQFCKGTKKIAKFISSKKCTKIVGGGNTAQIIDKLKLFKKFTHVSTGGGATLDFIENGTLLGIQALERSFAKFKKYKKSARI